MSAIKSFIRWVEKPITSRGATFLASFSAFCLANEFYQGDRPWLVAFTAAYMVYFVIVAIRAD